MKSESTASVVPRRLAGSGLVLPKNSAASPPLGGGGPRRVEAKYVGWWWSAVGVGVVVVGAGVGGGRLESEGAGVFPKNWAEFPPFIEAKPRKQHSRVLEKRGVGLSDVLGGENVKLEEGVGVGVGEGVGDGGEVGG